MVEYEQIIEQEFEGEDARKRADRFIERKEARGYKVIASEERMEEDKKIIKLRLGKPKEEKEVNREKSSLLSSKKGKIAALLVVGLIIGSILFVMADNDGDGIPNREEMTTEGLDMNSADSNGDGITDDKVLKYNLDPTEEYSDLAVDYVEEVARDEMNENGNYIPEEKRKYLDKINDKEQPLMDVASSLIGDGLDERDFRIMGAVEKNSNVTDAAENLVGDGLDGIEIRLLNLTASNPHNINPQIYAFGPTEDGEVTPKEMKKVTDPDEDGAITYFENNVIGSDPGDPDTDDDGVPDGVEYFGFQRKKGDDWLQSIALGEWSEKNQALRSNIYVQFEDNKYLPHAEELRSVQDLWANTSVENPDGSEGIYVLIDADEIKTDDNRTVHDFRKPVDDPKTAKLQANSGYGIFRFGRIRPPTDPPQDRGNVGYGLAPGAAFAIDEDYLHQAYNPEKVPSLSENEDAYVATLVDHVLGHNTIPCSEANDENDTLNIYTSAHLDLHDDGIMDPEDMGYVKSIWAPRNDGTTQFHPKTEEVLDEHGLVGLPDPAPWRIHYPEDPNTHLP